MEETYIPTDDEMNLAFGMEAAKSSFEFLGDEVALFKTTVKNQILEGYLNPLEFYRKAKIITEAIEDLKKDPDVFDCAWNERQKFGKDKAIVNGSVIEIGQRSTPDYKSCEDPVYNELKEKLKARERFLQSLPDTGTVDPETGLLIKAPVQKISTYITVKI
jgi:hypothetical protein